MNEPDLFNTADTFALRGEPLDNSITPEGEARLRALAENEGRKAQTTFCERCGKPHASSLPHCATCHRELWTEKQPDKRYQYRTAWTLVGGYAFTSQQCVAVRYIGLGQFRINETAETLHECHLRDFGL